MYCESFDLDRDFGAHIAKYLIQFGTSEQVRELIQIRTSDCVSQII